MKRSGRKSAAQTPAPKKERIYGSSKNPKGSAASKKSASRIQLSESIVKTLEDKKDKYNATHKIKVSLATLKAVMRRGMGAYSSSHRPTITGGAPNSRQAWGFARVNKFLLKKAGTKVKAAYVQDDDLMAKGGELGKDISCVNCGHSWNTSQSDDFDKYVCHKCGFDNRTFYDSDPIGYNDGGLLHALDVSKTNLKKNGIVLTDNTGSVTVIAYNTGNQESKPSLYNKSLIYKSVEPLQSKNEIIQNLDLQNFESFDESKIEDYKNSQLIILNQNEVVYDSNNPDIRFKDGGEMEKQIALPDTYADYDTLKPILAKQGYMIKKIENDIPVGKLAKGMSLSEVANRHGMTADQLKGELALGIEREMEHTDQPEYARAIAMDHLFENPEYYTKMKKMEGVDKHYEDISNKFEKGGAINPVFSFTTPTGEPSRLGYLQQVLVRTTSFKKFFGDWEMAAKSYLLDKKDNFKKHYKGVSIVIENSTLEPKLLFHGTRTDKEFFRFDVTKEVGVGRPYGYFAHNKEYSERFTSSSQRGFSNAKPYLYQVFLDVKNPFFAVGDKYELKNKTASEWLGTVIDSIAHDQYGENPDEYDMQSVTRVVKSQIESYFQKIFQDGQGPFWRLMAADIEKDFKYLLMTYGYDGIFYAEEYSTYYDPENPADFTKAVTIFDSKQVKLGDGRNLNFNPLVDDIRYEEGGAVTEHTKSNQHDMNKKMKLGAILFGDTYAEGGEVIDSKGKATNDGKKGGYFKGRSHAEGGIKAVNVDTGQLIEVEGEEVIITKDAVNDESKREFEGEMLTNREILSRINQSGGGVSFEDGGELKGSSCGCSGKKYNYGGEVLEDYHIIKRLTQPYDTVQAGFNKARAFADDLVSKMK